MYCLLTDETNAEASAKAKFFIYGGLFFPLDKLPDLDRNVGTIRAKAGYKLGDSFKFDTNFRPKHVSIEASTEAKKEVVQFCRDLGCRFIALVILHSIIDQSKPENKYLWAADHVIGRFNRFLADEGKDTGIVLIDTLPLKQQWQYLSDKFVNGLHLQSGNTVSLDRIRLYASTCLNASYVASAIDIVLGSFRYCVNDPTNRSTATEMLRGVARLMWHVRAGDRILLRDRGLIFRPEVVKVDAYRKEYDNLQEHLTALIRGK
jgi:hypothetical protein